MRKKVIKTSTLIIIFLWLIPLSAAGQNESTGQKPAIDAKKRTEIVEKIADILDKNYVFPEVGKKMGDLIKQNLKAGEYDRITKAYTFAGKLTSDLREVSKDLHLRVIYDPKTASVLIKNLKWR